MNNETKTIVESVVGTVLVVLFCLFCCGVFTGCGSDDVVSAPSRICYGKKLYYEDVCGNWAANHSIEEYMNEHIRDSLAKYYEGLCARWLVEGYDSLTNRYDQSHYLVDTREIVCLDDVTFE